MSTDKVALVIGAGDATGGAIARRFAREGYTACVTRRTAAPLEPLLAQIRAAGGQAHGFGCDARVEEQVVALFEQIERDIGPVEVLVFNIGGNVNFSITETTDRPEPPNAANGFFDSWSVIPPRRSSSSTAWAGVVSLGLLAAPTIDPITRNGMSTKNNTRPANTPAMVRRNCFIGDPGWNSRPRYMGPRLRQMNSGTHSPRNRLVGKDFAGRGKMVGVKGFEPSTPASRRRCSTRLSYTPTRGGGL